MDSYKSVSFAFASLAISDDDRFFQITELLEILSQGLIGGVIGQTTHKDLGIGGVLV